MLYAAGISQLSIEVAGLARSAGFIVGLAVVPRAGRWVDTGARTRPMMATLLIRALGMASLLLIPGPAGFVITCVLQGIGNQAGPVTQGAVVSSLSRGFERDAVLASIRSLGNAGLGAGALLATVAAAAGGLGMQWLAAATGVAYLISLLLISTVAIPAVDLAASSRRRHLGPLDEADKPAMRQLNLLNVANLPYALCFDILEVALPAILVTQLLASASWASGIFVGNTVLVIVLQLPVGIWMARRQRKTVFALAGLVLSVSYLGFFAAGSLGGNAGAAGLAAVSVLYTLGEIMYTGVNSALVIDVAPPHLLGRALARWQLSAGFGKAVAPFIITVLIGIGTGWLWLVLIAGTLVGAVLIYFLAPCDAQLRSVGLAVRSNDTSNNKAADRLRKALRQREREILLADYGAMGMICHCRDVAKDSRTWYSERRPAMENIVNYDVEVLRLNAFAASAGGGNPAGVVLDASQLSADQMQAMAKQLGYAESAFVTQIPQPPTELTPGSVGIRYFSPYAGVPFCGHATVATAVALAERYGVGSYLFDTKSGEIKLETSQHGDSITASFTSVEPKGTEISAEVLATLLELLGLTAADLRVDYPPRIAYAGNPHPVLVISEDLIFDSFEFDPALIRQLMDQQGWTGTITVLRLLNAQTFEARNLFPVGVITEDPATGSAAASVGAYLRALGLVQTPTQVQIQQGRHVGRPSILEVDIPEHGGITVTGSATQL